MVGAAELGAIPTAATVFLRLAERVYEVLAVTPQIKDLVDTTTQTSRKLRNARVLRRQRSRLLSQLEKSIIEDAFVATEKAIDVVARIIEPARADMDISGGLEAGRVGIGNSILFVIRDASKILVSHQKLMQASSDLNMAIITLNSKIGERMPISPSDSTLPSQNRLPTYHESQALYRSRERNLRRRESALLRPQPDAFTSIITPSQPVASRLLIASDSFELPGSCVAPSTFVPSQTLPSYQDADKIVVEDPICSPYVAPLTHVRTTAEAKLTGHARSRAWLADWF